MNTKERNARKIGSGTRIVRIAIDLVVTMERMSRQTHIPMSQIASAAIDYGLNHMVLKPTGDYTISFEEVARWD